MTTAFVLSGGGSLGAVQVGMLQALAERAIAPDLLLGTSAGALNAVFVAAHGTRPPALDRLAAIWTALRRDDVFPVRAPQVVLALAGARDALCSDHGLERLVRRHIGFARLEDAPIPVHLVATDLLSGEEVLLSDGDAVSAVLASSAVPAVLPPVRRNGQTLVDGGLADNAAISQALVLGADRVYVLPTGYACALPFPPTRPLAVAVQALSLLVQQRLIADVARYADQVDLVVLPPLCPLRISAIDFRHAAELCRRARTAAAAWLDSDAPGRPDPERVLGLHGHPSPPTGDAHRTDLPA
ncbi:patatin-like phospholipase family protein [Geodermatophilus sabuli]|uniref:NTE family protein n=1 Tax=Geodermatophilus sabuli TaxID=1564158 RepID=A0A285EBH0_9ACTN|nr:patatin-like phospholipase family protein [Geodermatophilus sabuli]MBB3084402.1 NTE family protein [Geodermatophilus sabuli]SNX96330.1 NTE family protein [Geodermatophilus sabuli]